MEKEIQIQNREILLAILNVQLRTAEELTGKKVTVLVKNQNGKQVECFGSDVSFSAS